LTQAASGGFEENGGGTLRRTICIVNRERKFRKPLKKKNSTNIATQSLTW